MAWTDCLLNPFDCAASTGTNAITDSWWNSFLNWMARGLTDVTSYVFQAFSTSTAPRFDHQWWQDNLALMITISLPLLVAAFVLQCVSAVIRREPARLGHALMGALLGTAGVPLAVAVVRSCGLAVDEISTAILGNRATADGLKRMVQLAGFPAGATLGGFFLTAVILGLIASISLYFVMLIREVAIVAFVVFAPIAMASWTWSATRHWLRRWIEVVGALVFSKVAMAVVFTVGLSAAGNVDKNGDASIGTFLTGVLLLAMAAFAPIATFSFIHWAGDHGQTAVHALQQGTAGPAALKERFDQAQQWRAHHFGGSSSGTDDGQVVGGASDSADQQSADSPASVDQVEPTTAGGGVGSPTTGGDAGSTAIAIAASQSTNDGPSGAAPSPDGGNSGDQAGSERQ